MTTISTILLLNEELKNFTREVLPLGLKYKLEAYAKKVREIAEPIDLARNELILSLSGGGQNIPTQIDGKPNPLFAEYLEKWKEILDEPQELPTPIPAIALERIENLETTNSYPLIFEYLVVDSSEDVK